MTLERKSSWIKLIVVLLAALFFAAAFHAVVYFHFQKFRTRIADSTEPDIDGNILLDFEATPEERNTFQTILLRLTNQSNQPNEIVLQLNGIFVDAVKLPANDSEKFNLHLVEKSNWRKHNKLKLKANLPPGWTLDRAEIANYYRASKGLINLILLNKQTSYESPGVWWSVALFLLLAITGLFLVWKRDLGFLPRVHLVILFLIFAVVLSALILPIISKYRLVFSIPTFLFFIALAYFPLLPVLLSPRASEETPDRRLFFASLSVIAIFVFYLSTMLHSLDVYGNYSSFLRLTDRAVRRNPFLRERKEIRESLVTYDSGYDATFMYFIAYDPFLTRFSASEREYGKFIDFPPYRYGRIGFPLLTKLFSLDKPQYYPQTMMLLIVFSHLIAAFFLVKLLLHYRLHPLWALLYICVPAFCVSLENGLPESVAAAFLIAAVYFYFKDRLYFSAFASAASILVRETSAIFVLVFIIYEAVRRNWKRSLQLALALLPYALWKIYLGTKFGDEYGIRAITGGGDVFQLPFGGLTQLLISIGHGTFVGNAQGAVFFALLAVSLFLLSLLSLRQTKHPITIAFLVYASIAICLNYRKVWLFLPNAERATYEAFIFLVLAFLITRPNLTKQMRIAYLTLVGVIFFYDLFFLSVASSFRAGFSLLFD